MKEPVIKKNRIKERQVRDAIRVLSDKKNKKMIKEFTRE